MMELKVSEWKEFSLTRICQISMGNKFDNDKMSHENPTVNFVSRTAENNGVADFVDAINGIEPYAAGSLTVALGGSIGSCFLQEKPFYTGQNVAVLVFDSVVGDTAKLFLSTLFMHECHSKFVAFGRELNTHIRTDLTLFLPVQHDAAGQPVIDPSRKYSDDGYVPDWNFMEQYMKFLNTQPLVTQRGGSALPTLGVDRWKEFQVGRFFKAERGMRHIAEDRLPGNIPYYSASQDNNGLTDMISNPLFLSENALIFSTFGDCYYVKDCFTASDEMTILKCDGLTETVGLFLSTVLSQSKYKFAFGRKAFQNKLLDEWFKLPVQHDATGHPVIDPSRKYSDDGYIPDWMFMERYIGSLPGSDLI